jgi:two-component system, LytTR family, sensor histidine kinase AlgZ
MLAVSIRHDVSTDPQADQLPDFRNLGVVARALVGANLLALAASLAVSADLAQTLDRFVAAAMLLEPLLIACLIALSLASPLLARLPYWAGCAVAAALVLGLTAGEHAAFERIVGEAPANLWRMLALSALAVAVLLGYFRLFTRAHSPALAEARLQALQARIRPHFLFNSLNAVLSLIRRDPKRAERALEDLADLFRTLMGDARRFVRLADEIALLERYAGIEQLRLGDRLRITWELDSAPSDALLPPLVLQPLLENAVHHGVEPGTGTADVLVRIERRGDRVLARIENPYAEPRERPSGNRMALDNIRERLALFFDAEARMEATRRGERYSVELEMPYRHAG